MSVYGVIINTTLSGSNGDFDLTDPLVTSTPKMVLVTLTDGTTLGLEDSDIKMSWGASDGNIQQCFSVQADDGGASANVERVQKSAVGQRKPTLDGSSDLVTFVTFLSNGVRLNLADAAGFSKRITVTLFGGDQLEKAEVLVANLSNGAGSPQTFNWLDSSLDANVMLFLTAGTSASDGVTSAAVACLGVGIKVDGSITQRNLNFRVDVDGAASGNPGQTYSDNRVSGSLLLTNAVQWEADLSNIGVGDFELTPMISTPNDEIMCIGLQFKDMNIGLESVTMPTSVGNFDVTSFAFRPMFALGIFSMLPSFNSAAFNADSGVVCTSIVNDSGAMFSHAWRNQDAAPTINCGSTVAASAIYCPFHNQSSISSTASSTNGFTTGSNPMVFLKDGLRYNFDGVNTGTKMGWIFAMGPKGVSKLINSGLVNNGLVGGRRVC